MWTVGHRVRIITQALISLRLIAGCGSPRLRARGWSEEDLGKLLGGNFLRVFREVLQPR